MEAMGPITALETGPARVVHPGPPGPGKARDCSTAHTAPRAQVARTLHRGAHCGAACTLCHIIGESAVFGDSSAIARAGLWPEYIVDLALARVLGILFQYFAINSISGLAPGGRSSRPRESRTDQRELSGGHARRLRALTRAANFLAWKLETH